MLWNNIKSIGEVQPISTEFGVIRCLASIFKPMLLKSLYHFKMKMSLFVAQTFSLCRMRLHLTKN